MLRAVTIENFVRFKERVNLKFEEGANFIIGGNSTGKSSVFELIRRCYSKSINTSDSTVFNKTEIAYTVCCYDPIEDITLEGEKIDKLFSSYIIEPGKNKLKILGVKIGNKVKIAGITAGQDKGKDVVDFSFEYSDEKEWVKKIMSIPSQDSKDNMTNSRQDSKDDIPTPSMGDIKCLMSLPGVTNRHKTEKLEEPLLEVFQKLTESFVNTFAMRSIGPLQWNKSKHLTNHAKNYTEANERAEILHELLKKQENDDYFESMMSPKKVEFNIGPDNKIYVIIDGKTESRVSILKISEGIIEAKELSLILKHKHFRTICLEEPDHGMHPQLIERMRNCVLRVVKGKTVIIVSHHPSLLNKWALERTHVCIQGDDARSSKIHKLNFIGKNYAECEEIKKLLFSSHVLLVEGDSDAICIQALLDLCEDIDWISKEELRNCQKVQIIKLFSKHNYRNVSQVCTKLKIKHMVLLDSDALQTEGLRKILFRDKDDTNYNKEDFEKNYSEIKDKLKDNVFVWREGNLENVTGEKKKTWWQDKTSDQIKEKVKKLLGKPDEDKSFNLLLKAIVKYFQEKNEN